MSTSIVAPNDGFYTQAGYKGAFGTSTLWAESWTALDALGFLPCETVITPAVVVAVPPNAVTLTITPSDANANINCNSQVGYSYQLESSATLNPAAWGNEGAVQAGTGSTLTFTVPATGAKYFRVRAN